MVEGSLMDVISSCSPRSDSSTLIPRGLHAVAMVTAGLALDTVCGSSRSIPRDSIDIIVFSIPRSRDTT